MDKEEKSKTNWACEMAQWIKAFAVKPNSQILILGTHMMEREDKIYQTAL